MKKAVPIILLAVMAVVGWRSCLRVRTASGTGDRQGFRGRVPVIAEPVRRQTIRDVAEFTGTLLPLSRFVVAPKVPGRLEKLLVNIGDSVTNRQLVAVLDGEEYAQQVAQARAELEVSRANLAESRIALDVGRREFERVRSLREQKVASEAELDEAEARFRAAEARQQVAEAQIAQREAALRVAEVRLAYTRIRAEWEGGGDPRAIAERFVDEGAMLRANDAIASVVDISAVVAVINVIERDFPAIEVGQLSEISTDAYPGRRFAGSVVRKAPVLREETRQVRVEIEVPNPDRALAPGMFIRAGIEFAEHPDAATVPVSSLVRRNGQQGIFLVDEVGMKARFVQVEPGFTQGGVVEILAPPVDGMVVTLGQHLLEDGLDIALPEQDRTSEDPAPEASPGRPSGEGGEGRP